MLDLVVEGTIDTADLEEGEAIAMTAGIDMAVRGEIARL